MLSAEQIVSKWQNRATSGSAKQAYLDGANSVQESPTEKAAAAESLYLQRVEEASRSGRRAAALRAVTLDQWKAAVRAKGDRFSSGIQAGVERYRQAIAGKWAGVYAQASQAAKAIPNDGSTDAAVNRVRAAITVMKAAAGRS